MALQKQKIQSLQVSGNQIQAIKLLKKLNAPIGLSFFYEKYMENVYHFVRYDIKEHKDICMKIAVLFSKYPHIFLGPKRSEIQLDNDSVTLSCNDWIECKSLQSIEIDFMVEYYIYTVNNFPVTIFFRINKNIQDYEEILMNFINYLIDIPLLLNDNAEMQQTMIEIEQLKDIPSCNLRDQKIENITSSYNLIDQHTRTQNVTPKDIPSCNLIDQHTIIQNAQLMTIDDDNILDNIVFTVIMISKRKEIYITIMLYCGILATCTIINSYTKYTNSSSYNQ